MDVNRILGLDGVRAYAALMVVVSHMYLFIELYNNNSPYYSLVRGVIGVQIFFILSGFLITNLLASQPTTKSKHLHQNSVTKINLKHIIFKTFGYSILYFLLMVYSTF